MAGNSHQDGENGSDRKYNQTIIISGTGSNYTKTSSGSGSQGWESQKKSGLDSCKLRAQALSQVLEAKHRAGGRYGLGLVSLL